MDRVEPFSLLADAQTLLRSRAIARAALLCLLLAALTTLAHAGTVIDSTGQMVSVTGGRTSGSLLIQLMSDGFGRPTAEQVFPSRR
ncbi:hypothetical protein Amn_01300 [Aminobacter sp. Y103A]|uniref:hypothetical protein n=1 Tax=Aminobacter sp. Y103A TaxID=1870862 RepID=UPI0025723E51|nr:hypothetical protein [Aminobacter sp. SS-2016]BBD35250.1 hypothetical protein Amn_01300 [Aminobacter sp. SS-2016]